MDTANNTQIVVELGTVKQRVTAMVAAILDDIPNIIEGSNFDPITKKLIASLVEKQLPKMIASVLEKTTDEKIENQIIYIRDDIIPFVLGVTASENPNQ